MAERTQRSHPTMAAVIEGDIVDFLRDGYCYRVWHGNGTRTHSRALNIPSLFIFSSNNNNNNNNNNNKISSKS